MDHTKEFRCVEWFFGYGGNHFGLKRVVPNLRLIAACEIEAYAIANMVAKMERGWLDPAPIWTDCRTFPAGPFKDRVDLFIASYPCQAESTAGKREGEKDPRYLWPYVRDFIKTARPLWVWCENVEGHISSGFPNVYADLSDMGYRVEAGIFSALEVGASQQRKRIFFLAKLAESDSYGSGDSLRDAVYERWGTGEGGTESIQIAARWAASFADGYLGAAGENETLGDSEYDGSPATKEYGSSDKASYNIEEGEDTPSEPERTSRSRSGQDVADTEDLHDGQGLSEEERGQIQQSGDSSIEGDMADSDELNGDNGGHGAGEVPQHEEAEVCGCSQDVDNPLCSECGAGRERAGHKEGTDTGGGCEGTIVADAVGQRPQGCKQREALHGDRDGQEAYGPAAQFREICVAPPGEEQYFWEALRVMDGSKGKRPVNGVDDLRQTEGDGDEPGEPSSSDGQGRDVADTKNKYDERIGESRGRRAGHSDENEEGDRERSFEPGLGGATDADPGGLDRLRSDGVDLTSIRADRLRLCGNGVDPITAAKAFVFLMRKHDESESVS